MGKTPFIGLMGLLIAGLTFTGCQSSTPRPRSWREPVRDSPPPPAVSKGPAAAEKRPAEVASDRDKGAKAGADFVSTGGGKGDQAPPFHEGPPPAPATPKTEAKSILPPLDEPPPSKAGQPGRDQDNLPVSKSAAPGDGPSLDKMPPPPITAIPGRSITPPAETGGAPRPLPLSTTAPTPMTGHDLPPLDATSSAPAPVPPVSPPSGPPAGLEPLPGSAPPPGTTPGK